MLLRSFMLLVFLQYSQVINYFWISTEALKLDNSDVFYVNSDSRRAYHSNFHPFQSGDIMETADLLVYKN